MNQAKEAELQLTEHATVRYTHSVREGTQFEELLVPEYWAHVAQKLRPHTVIEVIPEDGAYWAELLVLSCDRLWAKVFLMRHYDLQSVDADPAAVASLADGYAVLWKGPAKKHVVLRKSDAAILQEGIQQKSDAQLWLTEHLKTVAV